MCVGKALKKKTNQYYYHLAVFLKIKIKEIKDKQGFRTLKALEKDGWRKSMTKSIITLIF